MATILDIAKLAGVSQGTVSNVLNKKCKVSSDKIKKVMDAALELGYVPNERAKLLRKGHSNLLSIVLPNIQSKQYIEFYLGFKSYADTHNYEVLIQLTNDNISEEKNAIQKSRSYMACGIAAFTSFQTDTIYNPYVDESGSLKNNEQLLFIDRKVPYSNNFVGFDYESAGKNLAQKAISSAYSNICLLTGPLYHSNEHDFYRGFMDEISKSHCGVQHIQIDSHCKSQNIMQFFDSRIPQAMFLSNYDFAECVKDLYNMFYYTEHLPIYTISPLFTMPENDFIKYELNYRKLGNVAAQKIIDCLEYSKDIGTTILKASGFRNWYDHIYVHSMPKPLNLLTLDTPSAYSTKHLSKLYTKKTGIPIQIQTLSYDEMYNVLSSLNKDSGYDILRIDITWLNWFSKKILMPMDEIDSSIFQDLENFIPSTVTPYSIIDNHVYSMPYTPSIQMLFYRKDLFENSIYQQMYWEQYKKNLVVPSSFEEFNHIARFFTKAYNPISPVDYGATLTLGSYGVASSEYLVRLFSQQEHLYDKNGNVQLNSVLSKWALENLIETQKYSPPQYCNWWTNTAEKFAEGNIAMAIIYSNFASNILNPNSKIIGKVGFSSTPGHNPVIGGGYLGISKYSNRPQEALSYIRWACSEPISSARTSMGSTSPCVLTYDNYEILNRYPWLDLAQKDFTNCRGRRTLPTNNTPFNEYKFVEILGNAIKNVYHANKPLNKALDEAQLKFDSFFVTNKFI